MNQISFSFKIARFMLRFVQSMAVALCLLSFVNCPSSLHGQTIPPPFINYQAVLYDVNNPTPNAVFANQSFQTFVNINDELGNLLYREEHYASTDGNGLITVKMGDGLYVAGPITNFNQIDWGTGKYYLVVDFNINGTISSTAPEQLVTVPYSFYSGKAGNGMTSVVDNGNGTLTFNYVNGTSYTTAPLTGLQGSSGSFPPGTNVGDMYFWNGSSWQIVPIGTQGQFLTVSNGIPSWQSATPNLNLPLVTQLNCGAASFSGTVYQSSLTNGIAISLPYTGGNGIGYPAQNIQSVGITGLTATLISGVLANGNGVLSYTLSGIAAASGVANFPIVFGGQNCMLSVPVQSTTNNSYPNGSVFCASGPTAIVDVTNPITGRTWMDRNLGASQVATSSTDVAAYGDLYQWGRGSDGHQCRTSTYSTVLSSTDQPGNSFFIYMPNSPYDWRSPQNDNLWQGVNGTNNPCPTGYRIPTINELNTEMSSWSAQNSIGAFGSPLKFTLAGWRESGLAGEALSGRYWSSAAAFILAGNIYFDNNDPASEDEWPRNYGLSVRCIKDAASIPATLGSLNCGSTSITGTLASGTAASGVSASVPYTGGNGGSYSAQTISSTGVTGLTATLTSGILANGPGSLNLAIMGTPSTSGTASFALTIGGQSCSFTVSVQTAFVAQYPANSVFCASGPTAIVDVTNPATGKTWMDRNLGATQAATSSTDAASYGDLYQWGRANDGHQCRTSATTATLSSIDQPGNGNFILAPSAPNDWRSPQNANLWQGVNGVNNPCPSGYRIPTETEINNERLSWGQNTSAGAFASPLKLPMAGYRASSNGSLGPVGTVGSYWSSSVSGANSAYLFFVSNNAVIGVSVRVAGHTVRCIKN
jgi:uncharacterized protein (TIGR02145 family)